MVSRTSLVAVAIVAAVVAGPAAAASIPTCGDGFVPNAIGGPCRTNLINLNTLTPPLTASSLAECYGEAEAWAVLTGNLGDGVIASFNSDLSTCVILYTKAGTAMEDFGDFSTCTLVEKHFVLAPYNIESCFVDASDDASDAPSPPTGNVAGDPHFVGFNSAKYDYHGKPGATFNVLSTKDTQVNAMLGPDLIAGLTYMSAIGVSTNGSRIKVGINESRLQVLVDDIEVTTAVPVELATSSVVVTEDAVTITTPDVVMVLSTHKGRFIDIDSVALLRAMPDIHGVLGQTAALDATESTTYTGEESDYYVTDLWASDFVHNLYNLDSAAVPVQRKAVDLSAHVIAQDVENPSAAVMNLVDEEA